MLFKHRGFAWWISGSKAMKVDPCCSNKIILPTATACKKPRIAFAPIHAALVPAKACKIPGQCDPSLLVWFLALGENQDAQHANMLPVLSQN